MAKERSLEATEFQHPNKIGIKEGIGYMLGDAGNLFVLTYVSSFLKVFYTDVLKIAESKVATLFLVTRLWDAINDPMWGTIVAKKSRIRTENSDPISNGLQYLSAFLQCSASLISEASQQAMQWFLCSHTLHISLSVCCTQA